MKKSFTLLELVFVIVVIGIIAAVVIPRQQGNSLEEAAIQVISHIRYTQHLAMVDDKFDPNDPLWFLENWQIQFESGGDQVGYMVYTDRNHLGNASNNELAQDPLSQRSISQATGVADLGGNYGISDIDFSNNCRRNGNTGRELAFDFLGRPYFFISDANPTAANIHEFLLTTQCQIILTHTDTSTITIGIEPETGYACVLDANNNCR